MTKLTYCTIEEFCEEIIDSLDDLCCVNESNDVSIICKYDDARKVVEELVRYGCDIASIDLSEPIDKAYKDEYIITISYEDNDIKIWCQPMKYDGKYLTDESSLTCIFD